MKHQSSEQTPQARAVHLFQLPRLLRGVGEQWSESGERRGATLHSSYHAHYSLHTCPTAATLYTQWYEKRNHGPPAARNHDGRRQGAPRPPPETCRAPYNLDLYYPPSNQILTTPLYGIRSGGLVAENGGIWTLVTLEAPVVMSERNWMHKQQVPQLAASPEQRESVDFQRRYRSL